MKRLLLCTALALVALTSGARTVPTSWTSLCPLYEPWSPLWIWNHCWDYPGPGAEG